MNEIDTLELRIVRIGMARQRLGTIIEAAVGADTGVVQPQPGGPAAGGTEDAVASIFDAFGSETHAAVMAAAARLRAMHAAASAELPGVPQDGVAENTSMAAVVDVQARVVDEPAAAVVQAAGQQHRPLGGV